MNEQNNDIYNQIATRKSRKKKSNPRNLNTFGSGENIAPKSNKLEVSQNNSSPDLDELVVFSKGKLLTLEAQIRKKYDDFLHQNKDLISWDTFLEAALEKIFEDENLKDEICELATVKLQKRKISATKRRAKSMADKYN